MKTKICAVQCKVHPDFEKNLSGCEKFFKKASASKCHIICFPESFLDAGSGKDNYSGLNVAASKKEFSRLCKKYRLFAVMGSINEKIGKHFYNVSYIFDDFGKILGSYKKNHLVQDTEMLWKKPGNRAFVFRTKIGNIGIQVCRDILYPEITRKLMLKGAQIVFCPSFWCSKSSQYSSIYNKKYFGRKTPNEVSFLASARAIESEVFFVFVNAAGNFNKSSKNRLLGKTQIASPFYGKTACLESNREGILAYEAELKTVGYAKKIYRIEKDLKNYYAG